MNMVKASLQNRQVTLSILAMVFAFGVYSLFTMPRREDPRLTVPQALVVSYFPGATAAQVEEQVTRKIEQYLFQHEEVRKLKTVSTSRDGVSVINVVLNDDIKTPDIFWSKLTQQLQVVKDLDLPPGVKGPILNAGFGETEAMLIAVESKTASYRQLKNYSQLIEDRLSTIPTTAKIKRIGEQKEQIAIYFDPDKLSQYGISLQQITTVLKSQNVVCPTGEAETGNNHVALYTKGYYSSQGDIANQIVGTSKTGEVVRLGELTTIKREYVEPSSSIEVNGNKAIIVAVQMRESKNIVQFGKEVTQKLAEVSKLLPSDITLTPVVNQPALVKNNVSGFLREFLLAIISVIVVVLLLLPLRIAAVAAAAIPMTIAVTFAVLNALGIVLHQVSLAAMITVLGMVVDDAIVVADNYVDLLDKGIDRATAAWRSATDLVVPIFTATITIIASFMPMLVITGVIGEFIHDLPITTTIALTSSFIVSMVLTPMLCYTFIKRGLKDPNAQGGKQKWSMLGVMQAWYNTAIEWSDRHRIITFSRTILTIILTLFIFLVAVRQKFFPFAERNQFIVEMWMPTGTKYDVTKQAATRIENEIKKDSRVTSYAVFTGASAPRVYYNYQPEFSVSNYAQLLINTPNKKSTEILAKELALKVDTLVPEAMVQVKLMQQGLPLASPIDVRIFGDDIGTLKRLGGEVKGIMQRANGSYQVRDDFMQDYYGISIDLKDEAARLGFSTENVSKLLYANISGAVVSTMYEANNPINIVLRSNADKRLTTQTIEDVYLESPITGKSVPLRQIARLSPQWQTGRIMHRNGLRCLTVRCETKDGVLPSELLAKIRPDIEKVRLPQGYRIAYGGEYANKAEVFGQMMVALVIGLLVIFVILMLQFKNLKETSIILFTIVLSYFGAIGGLAITHNDFGFTAMMGLISLTGIVCRNAIILLDYTNVLLAKGMDIRSAAIGAGKRRLRPVFLTAMAAAVGCSSLILSGSSLWSPLATVIAFGVTWSMLMDFFTVPILYIVFIKPKDKIQKRPGNNAALAGSIKAPIAIVMLLCALVAAPSLHAQEPVTRLGLQEITTLALRNNHLLKAKELTVHEKQQKVHEDMVKFLPDIRVAAGYQHNTNIPTMTFPRGSFGQLPMQGPTGVTYAPLPATDKTFDMGEYNTTRTGVMAYQPILEIPKIQAGLQVTKTEFEMSEIELAKTVLQIKQAAEKLFYGLLIARKLKVEKELDLAVAKAKHYDGESALSAEKTTASNLVGLNSAIAGEEQNLLKINIQIEDYCADLKKLAGIPDSVSLDLDSSGVNDLNMPDFKADSISEKALTGNTDLRIAGLMTKKAEYARKASAYSYLPDMGVIGGYTYQQGSDFYPKNDAFAGVTLKWNITDLLSNAYVKSQRDYMKLQAIENLADTRDQVKTDVAKALRKLRQSAELIAAAKTVVDYCNEDVKINTDKHDAGMTIQSGLLSAQAALAKAQADLLAAKLSYRMAYTDLQILTGAF